METKPSKGGAQPEVVSSENCPPVWVPSSPHPPTCPLGGVRALPPGCLISQNPPGWRPASPHPKPCVGFCVHSSAGPRGTGMAGWDRVEPGTHAVLPPAHLPWLSTGLTPLSATPALPCAQGTCGCAGELLWRQAVSPAAASTLLMCSDCSSCPGQLPGCSKL